MTAGLPFLLAAVWQGMHLPIIRRVLVLLAFFLWGCLMLVSSRQGFHWLPEPWQGMLFQGLFSLGVALAWRSQVDSGLRLRISRTAWLACLVGGLGLIAFTAARTGLLRILGMSSSDGIIASMQYYLYQATLPGIAEELVYRGVIQGGLNRIFGRPWRLFGASLGMGWLITLVIFWAMHAFQPDGAGLRFYWPTLTMQLWAGAVFGWMRERSGSLLPGIILHNLTNLVWTLI